MTRRNAMSPLERMAMADALRHMSQDGVPRDHLAFGTGVSFRTVFHAYSFFVLPGRDDTGTPLVGVVSPRHDDSSAAGDCDLPNLAGGSGAAAPVILPGAQPVEGVDGVEQRGAGDRVGGLGHGGVVARAASECHGAGKGRSVP